MNIKDETTAQLEEIANIVPEIQKIINETKESFEEKDYEKAEELIVRCGKIKRIIESLMETRKGAKHHIEWVETQKEKFPLVPIEDIEPNFQKFTQKVEHINNFYNSVKEYSFFELYEELEEKVDKYKRKVLDEQEQHFKEQTRKEIKEELEKFFKEPKDFKGKGAKVVISDPYLEIRYGDI